MTRGSFHGAKGAKLGLREPARALISADSDQDRKEKRRQDPRMVLMTPYWSQEGFLTERKTMDHNVDSGRISVFYFAKSTTLWEKASTLMGKASTLVHNSNEQSQHS